MNVFDSIAKYGDAEMFTPVDTEEATEAIAGSKEKIAVLQARAEAGEDLWHEDDNPEVRQAKGKQNKPVETQVIEFVRNGHGEIVSS